MRTIKIIILLIMSTQSIAQMNDTIRSFADKYEETFWNIISKNYCFSESEIEIYKKEINFTYLSSNQRISWNSNLIEKYENLLYPPSILKNKSINWNEELINIFVNRQWFKWSEVCLNKEITISNKLYKKEEENIQKQSIIKHNKDSITMFNKWAKGTIKSIYYKDFLRSYYSINDPSQFSNYREIEKLFYKKIKDIDASALAKHRKYINWDGFIKYSNYNWSWQKLDKLLYILNNKKLELSRTLYEKLFEPSLNKTNLTDLFKTIPKKIRFYNISSGDDKFGLVPSVLCHDKTTGNRINIDEEFNFPDEIPANLNHISFELESNREGPKRYADFMELYHNTAIGTFIISDKFRTLLENYNLPTHKYYSINVNFNSSIYGIDSVNMYLLILMNTDFLDNIDYNKTFLTKQNKIFNSEIDDGINKRLSKQKLLDYYNPQNHNKYSGLNICNIYLKKHFDFMRTKSDEFFVSKRLKQAIENVGCSGIRIVKNHEINWIINDYMGINKNEVHSMKKGDTYNQKNIKLYLKYKKKNKNILKDTNTVTKYYSNLESQALDIEEEKLRTVEKDLNVIFPDNYRNFIKTDKFLEYNKHNQQIEYFQMDDLTKTGKVWGNICPHVKNGVIIAKVGDVKYYGFILKEDSNYELDDTIYILNYSDWEVEKHCTFNK